MLYVASNEHVLGAFTSPSLRDVAHTAPDGHDGRFATLGDEVRFYSDLPGTPALGHREETLQPLALDDAEGSALVGFLHALTGPRADAGPARPPRPVGGQVLEYPEPVGPSLERQGTGSVPQGRRGCFIRLALSVLAIPTLLFLAAEGVVRCVTPGLPPRGAVLASIKVSRTAGEHEAPGVGRVLEPEATVSQIYPVFGPDGELTEIEVVYNVSRLGIRDREFSLKKPAGVRRICVLGDSFTFGTAINLEDTYPKVMQRALAKLAPKLRVQVLNLGMEAINTAQEVALLENRAVKFEPDIVLLTTHVNDASGYGITAPDRGAPSANQTWIERLGLTSGVHDPGAKQTGAQRRTMSLRRQSRLVDLLANRLHYALYGSVLVENYIADWKPGGSGSLEFTDALRRAAALAEEHGFELHVAHYPMLTQLDGGYPLLEVRDRIAELTAAEGLPFHDLLPVFTGNDARELWAHAHDSHPGPRANKIAGRALAKGLLPHLR